MKQRTSCDPEILRQLKAGILTTNPDTGQVYRHGKEAGRPQSTGYLQVHIGNGRRALAHRIVWMDANGPIPDGYEMNHINHQRTDNRLTNLELVTRAENLAHAAGRILYTKVRAKDIVQVAEQNPEWFAALKALADRGDEVTPEEIRELRELMGDPHALAEHVA